MLHFSPGARVNRKQTVRFPEPKSARQRGGELLATSLSFSGVRAVAHSVPKLA